MHTKLKQYLMCPLETEVFQGILRRCANEMVPKRKPFQPEQNSNIFQI